MAKKHKFFATTATAALVASAIVPVASAAELNDFDKVATWAQDAVQYLADNEILQGDTKGNFNPTGTLTRAQAAEVLYKALDLEATGTEDFSDVAENQWFYDAVVATSPELFEGNGNGKFDPQAKLTRAQAAKVLVIAYELEGEADLSKFPDADKVPAWAKEYFATAVETGVINGKGSKLAPNDDISRQEFATMVKRAMDTSVNLEVKSVSAVDTITVKEGAEVAFPETVEVTLSNDEKATKAVKWDTTKLDTAKPGEYTVKGDVEDTDLEASVKVVVEAVAPEVTAVSAVNAKEIVVEFNTAVDEVTAENESNYTLKVAGVAETNFTAKVDKENAKKVVLTLTDAAKLANDEAVQLTVKKAILSDNLLAGTEDFSKTWVFSDKTAPVITKVEKDGDDLKVTFDDYVSAVSLAKVNNVDKTSSVAAISSLTKTVVITDGVKGLGNGNYSVLLSGVTDAAGNVSSVLRGTVNVSADAVAPTVSKIEQTEDNKLKVTFNKEVSLVGSENFVVTKNGYKLGVTSATTDNKVYTLTLADAGAVKVYDTGADTSAVELSVSGFKGTSNDLVGDAYTTSVTLSKDKTAPTVVSRFNTITDLGTDGSPNEVFDIYFNEEVVLDPSFVNGDITLTDKDGIRQAVTSATVVDDANGDAKILRVVSSAVQTEGVIKTGNYNINLSSGVVADNAGNDISAKNVSISKSATASNVTATATATSNVITVSYNTDMTTSATTLENYMLDGAALPEGTLIYFDTNNRTVKIELPNGSVESTGGAVLTISDSVVSKSDNKLATASKTQNIATGFVDNVKPVLASAKKTSSTTIELTFSEDIADTTLATNAANNDFIVKVNGVEFAYTATTGSGANDNKIVLTTTAAYNTAQPVTVSVTDVAADISVSDGANTLTLGTTVTASN